MKNSKGLKDLERVTKALANRRRLAILAYLKVARQASVGDIAEEIDLSFKATSKHLGILSAAGVLERDQRSLQMLYRLADEFPPAVRPFLSLL
jgi:DNA-binding transcriptional ArsR family regulator